MLQEGKVSVYIFHRAEGFYLLELSDDAQAKANAECNPGTIKVVRIDADREEEVWTASPRCSSGPAKPEPTELLPCPFCGGRNAMITLAHAGSPVHHVAICAPTEAGGGCGASATWEDSEAKAAAAWNRRTRP